MDHVRFHPFPDFPPEIRYLIWRFSLGDPRVHRIRISPEPPSNEMPEHTLLSQLLQRPQQETKQNLVLHSTESIARSTRTARSLLATCRESREEILQALPDSLLLQNGHLVHFNKTEDVICLPGLDVRVVRTVIGVARSLKETGSNVPWGEIQNLAIDPWNPEVTDNMSCNQFWCVFSPSETLKLTELPLFLTSFTGLQWLFLVTLPLSGDPDSVVGGTRSGSNDHAVEEEGGGAEDDEAVSVEAQATPGSPGVANSTLPICGPWLRGEDGLLDWYRRLPGQASWDFPDSLAQEHFEETASIAGELLGSCKDGGIGGFLAMGRPLVSDEESARMRELFTEVELQRLRNLRVEAMAHFREGVALSRLVVRDYSFV